MVIVGAGIGGLAAAHRLQLLAAERRRPLEILVLEASGRSGGVLGTESGEGALLERGPDTLVAHKPAGIALCRRLGLADRLVYLQPGRIDILRQGRLLPIPLGFALLAPTRGWPLLRSPLLGLGGKLRALAEPLIPRAGWRSGAWAASATSPEADESVGSFVRRRFGAAVLERLVEPVVGAIYMADVERLSLAATFPRFLALEQEHGSLTRVLRRPAPSRGGPAPTPPAPFATLSGGLGQIAESLVARLPPGCLRLNTRVVSLAREREGLALRLGDGSSIAAAAVLVAVPADRAAALSRDLDPGLAERLGELAYASCAVVHLAWRRRAVERPPSTQGFFVPGSAGSEVVAASFLDVKYPERVAAGQVVVRVFLGGALRPEVAGRAGHDLAEVATCVLGPLLGAREPPIWTRVHLHPQAMPQVAVGHLARAARLRAWLAQRPELVGLELAGGPLGAFGIPDSVAAAESAAERLFDRLGWGDRAAG